MCTSARAPGSALRGRTRPLSLALALALALALSAGCTMEEPTDLDAERYRSATDTEPELRTGTIATPSGALAIGYEMIDGLAIFQGDMVIPWSDFVDRSVAHAGTAARDQRWPSRTPT